MRKAIWKFGLVAASVAMLAACAREQPRPAPPVSGPARPAPRPAPSAPLNDAQYVARASSIDLYEIRSSEMAMQRAANARTKEFATMIIQGHTGTSGQLSLAGRRLNLLPSARLDADHQAMIDALSVAPNFDALYRQQQTGVHREALALHSTYAARGTSPTLRPVAAAIVPVIERHQRMLRYL